MNEEERIRILNKEHLLKEIDELEIKLRQLEEKEREAQASGYYEIKTIETGDGLVLFDTKRKI